MCILTGNTFVSAEGCGPGPLGSDPRGGAFIFSDGRDRPQELDVPFPQAPGRPAEQVFPGESRPGTNRQALLALGSPGIQETKAALRFLCES